MAGGEAMAFLISGGIISVWTAVPVFALVRGRYSSPTSPWRWSGRRWQDGDTRWRSRDRARFGYQRQRCVVDLAVVQIEHPDDNSTSPTRHGYSRNTRCIACTRFRCADGRFDRRGLNAGEESRRAVAPTEPPTAPRHSGPRRLPVSGDLPSHVTQSFSAPEYPVQFRCLMSTVPAGSWAVSTPRPSPQSSIRPREPVRITVQRYWCENFTDSRLRTRI